MKRDTSSKSPRPTNHIETKPSAEKREGVPLERREPEGDFFARLDAARERLGIKAMPPAWHLAVPIYRLQPAASAA